MRLAVAGLVGLGLTLPELAFAGPPPVGLANSSEAVNPLIVEVKKWRDKNWKGKKWKPTSMLGRAGISMSAAGGIGPCYGTIIAGVALGTILGVAIAGTPPPRLSPDLRWYWTDPARNRGYWGYCY